MIPSDALASKETQSTSLRMMGCVGYRTCKISHVCFKGISLVSTCRLLAALRDSAEPLIHDIESRRQHDAGSLDNRRCSPLGLFQDFFLINSKNIPFEH